MQLPNEQALTIEYSASSSPIKAFWVASHIPEELDYRPRVAYEQHVDVVNYQQVNGYVELVAKKTIHPSEDHSVLQPQQGYVFLRTNTDTPIFSATTSAERTVLACHMVVSSRPEQLAMPALELFNTALNKKISVACGVGTQMVVTIFGASTVFTIPDAVVYQNNVNGFITNKFLICIDTKMTSIPPIKPGASANYRVSVRMLYNGVEYPMHSVDTNMDPRTRFFFEARQDTNS